MESLQALMMGRCIPREERIRELELELSRLIRERREEERKLRGE